SLHTSLVYAELQIGQRAFPARPRRESSHFAHRKRRSEAGSAFGWSERKVMLDAITLKCFRAAIVHVHRQRDRNRALRIHQPFPIVFVDAEIVRNDLKLVAGHFENFVVVDRHETRSEFRAPSKAMQVGISAAGIASSNRNITNAEIRTPKFESRNKSQNPND